LPTSAKMICSNEANHSALADSVSRVRIGNALVHSCGFDEMLESIVRSAHSGQPNYVLTPNAQHVVLLDRDKNLQTIYSEAAFVLPDGVSLLLAARLLGRKLPHRLAGVDMFQALCKRAADEGLRIFLLGGRPGSAEKAAEKLLANSPGLIISGIFCPPHGFEDDPSQQEEIQARIRAANPHLLFVAFGAPKQEYWIHEHARNLGVPIAMGVGGSFEMVGGIVPRAPMWMRKTGLEWVHRLVREPRRMWRRYLIGSLQFAVVVLRQRLNFQSANENLLTH
jgi:N-acetylglucosaminyldiphosphoundecaprenol N-acetyl-beta-D-mannosaminyltransferase